MAKRAGLLAVALIGAVLAGCAPTTGSRTGDGAVVGGLAGGAIGGLATGTWGGAAVGAGIGAVTGAIIADSRGRCYRVNSNGTRTRVNCPR